MTFTLPWIFLLLPLPLVIRRILPPAKPSLIWALKTPFAEDLKPASGSLGWAGERARIIPWVIWPLLVSAAADPIQVVSTQERPSTGRDLFLAVDISGSMDTVDFGTDTQPFSRLNAVKDVAGRFVRDRGGDRLGLILFGDRPFLISPPTFDRKAIGRMLGEAEVALGGQSTAIGDAIGLAIKHMQGLQARSSVIIVFTDGANNAGTISPLQAARLAQKANIKLYSIGLGSPRIAMPDPRAAWTESKSDFGRDLLMEMAQTTGGLYFHALDRQGLDSVRTKLDQLEPSLGPDARRASATHLYYWPLSGAFLLSLFVGMASWRRQTQETQHG